MKGFNLSQRIKLISSFKMANDKQLDEIIELANLEKESRLKRAIKRVKSFKSKN